VGLAPKIAEIGKLGYKFAQKGYTSLSDIYKIWLGAGVSGLHPHTKFHRSGFKMWAYTASKIAKSRNFWYKFAHTGKLWGSIETVKS